MSNTNYDWATLQEYYDQGNSWRKVCEEFGCYNKTIQSAVKRGDLKSRSRGESISLALGGDGQARKTATCYCGKDFEYEVTKTKGLFCSYDCRSRHKWETDTVPRVLAGEAGHDTVRKYLLIEDARCAECSLGEEWNGKPISLQLDHIDGNSDNHQLENVRLLCPNCHSQTPNYGIRNKGQSSRRKSNMDRWRKGA